MASVPPIPPPHTRVGVGGVLILDDRALVNRAVYRTRFTIPSGYVEPGESLETAVVREFEEETEVKTRVSRLILVRHKVVRPEESDAFFAFVLEHVSGTPRAVPPEIAEFRLVPLADVAEAKWISELSRMAIRLGAEHAAGWPRSPWKGGESPGLSSEAYLPP